MTPRSFRFCMKIVIIGSLVFGATVAILDMLIRCTPPKIVRDPATHICYDKGLGAFILHQLYEVPPEKRPELWKDIQLGLGVLPPRLTSYGKDNLFLILEEYGCMVDCDRIEGLFVQPQPENHEDSESDT